MNTILKSSAMAVAMLVAGLGSMSASAAENPMESVGIEHNLYLECLSLSKDQSESPLKRLVEECGYDPGMQTEEFVKKYHDLVNVDPETTLADRLATSSIKYTEYERSFFYRIDAVVATASSLEDANAKFAKLEQEAVENISPKTTGGRSVLATFSTLRHSLDYWSKAEAGSADTQSFQRRPWWIKLIVAVVDAYVTAEAGSGIGSAASTVAGWLLDLIFD